MKKLGLFFYAFCACALLFVSCSGSNGTGEINFEITKADFEKFTQIYKDNSNNGDFECVGIVTVSLSGDYNETKSIIIPESDIERVSKYNLSFDGIPVGKSVYVDVDFSRKETTSDGLSSINQTHYGYSKEVKVRSGKNEVEVKLWNAYNVDAQARNYKFSFEKQEETSTSVMKHGYNLENENNPSYASYFDFCTSDTGSLFYITDTEGDSTSWTIKGDSGAFSDGINTNLHNAEYSFFPEPQRIFCDYSTGSCYVYGQGNYESIPKIVLADCGSNFELLESANGPQVKYISYEVNSGEESYDLQFLSVCTGKIYVLLTHTKFEHDENGDEKYTTNSWIYVYNLDTDGGEIDGYEPVEKIPADKLNDKAVTDMTCHEGSLYFLTRKCRMESNNNDGHSMFSYGGLYKYDIENELWSELGTNHTQKKKEEMTNIGCYFYTATQSPEILYVDGSTKPAVFIGSITDNNGNVRNAWDMFPDIVDTPSPVSGVSKTAFYGPEKFVAIKPKTLVIADDGFAFYTDENGALSYKNVNRFVTVDLQKFAISDVEETDANFNENFPDGSFDNPHTDSCCYYSFKEYLGDKKLRQSNGYSGTVYDYDEIKFGFSCKD